MSEVSLDNLRTVLIYKIKENNHTLKQLGYNLYVLTADKFLFDIDTHRETVKVREFVYNFSGKLIGNEEVSNFPLENDSQFYQECLKITNSFDAKKREEKNIQKIQKNQEEINYFLQKMQ